MNKLRYWEFNLDKFSHWAIIVSRSKEWALEVYLDCCGVSLDEKVYPKEIDVTDAIQHYEWYKCIFPDMTEEHKKMLERFYEYSEIEGIVLIC